MNILFSLILVLSLLIETTYGLNKSTDYLNPDEILNNEQINDEQDSLSTDDVEVLDLGLEDKQKSFESKFDSFDAISGTGSDASLSTMNELEEDSIPIDNQKATDTIEKELRGI